MARQDKQGLIVMGLNPSADKDINFPVSAVGFSQYLIQELISFFLYNANRD